jgi:hypothetical protein
MYLGLLYNRRGRYMEHWGRLPDRKAPLTIATTTNADVPVPAGAVTTYEWDDTHTPTPSRYWSGTRRRVGRAEILLDGTQWADGRIDRCLTVYGVNTDQNMPADTARKIAAALMQAANELDGLKA